MATNTLCTAQAVLLVLFAFSTAANAAPRNKNPNSLSPVERLGKELFFDKISDPGRMSCSTCHEDRRDLQQPVREDQPPELRALAGVVHDGAHDPAVQAVREHKRRLVEGVIGARPAVVDPQISLAATATG